MSDDATYVQELVAYIQDRAQSALGAVAFGRSGEQPPPPMPSLVEQREAVEPWLLRLAGSAALEYFAIRVARLPTLADAICDRLLHNAHRIVLQGPSRRKEGKLDS